MMAANLPPKLSLKQFLATTLYDLYMRENSALTTTPFPKYTITTNNNDGLISVSCGRAHGPITVIVTPEAYVTFVVMGPVSPLLITTILEHHNHFSVDNYNIKITGMRVVSGALKSFIIFYYLHITNSVPR